MEAMLALKVDQDAPTLAEVTGVPWPEPLEGFFRTMLARAREARPDSAERALDQWTAAVREGGAPAFDAAHATPAGPEGVSTTTLPRRRS